MYNFEVIESSDKRWNEIVKSADIYDFHHTAYFHQIDTVFDTKLLYFSYQDNFIALPIVLRPIENTSYFDITSVYGYAGPLSKISENGDLKILIENFKSEFINYCNQHNIISVFSRLHPLIDQKAILEGLGDIIDLNKTVTINLMLSADEQRKAYRKSLKSELNQLRKKGVVVVETTDKQDIDAFIDIYYETMDRVNATSNYYFSRDYFYNFLENEIFDSKLLVAKKENKVIAGAIFTLTDKIMQYHLAGTSEEFIRETPMKLILDEARLNGNETSAINLHLGGGVGGSSEDSLFKFKSGFSKDFKQFSIWKLIVNPQIYDELSANKTNTSYFPKYRFNG
ncbi:GNAT family N-acetyltransferase [Empedobacter brevis]